MRKFKWYIVILAFILTFSAVYFFNNWRQESLVEAPVKDEILHIEGVEKVTLERNGDSIKIYTELKEMKHLSEIYLEIEELLSAQFQDQSYELVMIDDRTEHLEKVYEKVHFSLMEGARRGNYQHMKEIVSGTLSEEENIRDYRIYVNNENIFLQIASEDGFLYEIIPVFGTDYVEDKSRT